MWQLSVICWTKILEKVKWWDLYLPIPVNLKERKVFFQVINVELSSYPGLDCTTRTEFKTFILIKRLKFGPKKVKGITGLSNNFGTFQEFVIS